jgi:hypothetical protein
VSVCLSVCLFLEQASSLDRFPEVSSSPESTSFTAFDEEDTYGGSEEEDTYIVQTLEPESTSWIAFA